MRGGHQQQVKPEHAKVMLPSMTGGCGLTVMNTTLWEPISGTVPYWEARNDALAEMLPQACEKTTDYISRHVALCQQIGKPLVIEEFGYPRDGFQFSRNATTRSRDGFIQHILNAVTSNAVIAGCNFWAWGGKAKAKHEMWKPHDPLMGDPPQEPQGLYSVFDTDISTRQLLQEAASKINKSK